MEDILKTLRDHIHTDEKEYPFLNRRKYEFSKITKDNFFKIKESSVKKVFFIDGGHQDIMISNSFSISYNKLCGVCFEGNRKKKIIPERFWISCVLKKREDALIYSVRSFSKDIRLSFEMDAFDSSLSENGRRIGPERVSSLARKLCEIIFAQRISEENDDSIIVMDGILLCNSELEKKEFEKLYSISRSNRNAVCSLSKTSSLVTNQGRPLAFSVNSIALESTWQYDVALSRTDMHHASIVLVKLHKGSEYVFRLEISKDSLNRKDEIITVLRKNSCDPVFLGYPYGLILADELARVSNKEKEYFRTILASNAKEEYQNLIELSRTTDAHSILDNIRF